MRKAAQRGGRMKEKGVAKATRFSATFKNSKGDSVKKIQRFWHGKSLEEIYRTIENEKITF